VWTTCAGNEYAGETRRVLVPIFFGFNSQYQYMNCPTCGEEFQSNRAVKIHHKLGHGESIAVEDSLCEECGKSFEYYPSSKKGIYCSDCVEEVQYRTTPTPGEGEDNHMWNGGMSSDIEVNCSNCGSEIIRTKSAVQKYDNFFCSDECKSEGFSEKYAGKGNPRYIDGNSKQRNYGKGWRRARLKCLKRDNRICQNCETSETELENSLDVHHKTPVRKFKEPENAHTLDNLVSLCRSCHVSAEVSEKL